MLAFTLTQEFYQSVVLIVFSRMLYTATSLLKNLLTTPSIKCSCLDGIEQQKDCFFLCGLVLPIDIS